MTDACFEICMARIKERLLHWRQELFLSEWDIHQEYSQIQLAGDRNNISKTGVYARTRSLWQYRKAWIEFSVPDFEDLTDTEFDTVIVHELLHSIVAPMRDSKDVNIEELVVTHLAHLIVSEPVR